MSLIALRKSLRSLRIDTVSGSESYVFDPMSILPLTFSKFSVFIVQVSQAKNVEIDRKFRNKFVKLLCENFKLIGANLQIVFFRFCIITRKIIKISNKKKEFQIKYQLGQVTSLLRYYMLKLEDSFY